MVFVILISVSAFGHEKSGGEFSNLKILPKNIDSKTLNRIMVDDFSDGLGVSCMFCHSENKDSHKIDYASDDNPMKEQARTMMKMTMGINKKYFGVKHPLLSDTALVIQCLSCHHGTAFPYPAE
ncbi:MAG TPA: c-type cytochrome [Flavisolibacter sp.]|nr:c-type cytochrome [Flavisolibacter sp.]